MVEARGHRFVSLPVQADVSRVEAIPPHAAWAPWGWEADAAATLDALSEPVDWLVVDHYALDARWERSLRPKTSRLLAIDDLADRDHDCDVLLDHNPQDEAGIRYAKRLPERARRLIGPRYALLRPEFATAREKRRERDGSVRRIAVFMGGTDPDGATLLAIEALSAPPLKHIHVDVAIGSASPHLGAIRAAAEARGNAAVLVDLPNLADLFGRADLAIGAGGVAALERCCVGLPTVTVAIADNQKRGLEWLADHGAVRHLGEAEGVTAESLSAELHALCSSPAQVRQLSQRAAAVVDGRGIVRVTSCLTGKTPEVTVRAAVAADAELLHRWRNSDPARAASFNSAPISFEDHCRWLDNALSNPLQLILIGAVAGNAVGSIRYALSDAGADISIVVAPEAQGRGIGGTLLEAGEVYLRTVHPEPLRLRAAIKPGNHASLRLFEAAGFTRSVEEAERVLYVKDLI
jgi:UDP-2,4-diacetamido-2,4,6-trideoxy-beta-L-altropyranose hydrolase